MQSSALLLGLIPPPPSPKARPTGYSQLKSIGEPSKQSISSRSMAITGVVLLGFLVLHLATFKFGRILLDYPRRYRSSGSG